MMCRFPLFGAFSGLYVVLATSCTWDEPPAKDVFRSQVVPVLEQHCSSSTCHGVSDETEDVDWEKLFFKTDGAGHILDMEAAYQTTKRTINTTENPAYSTLLRKPLPATFGGLSHYGGQSFHSPDASEYQTLYEWIASEQGGGEWTEPLSPLEEKYEQTVQPILAGAGCMSTNCHGSDSAVPYRLHSGILGEFSLEDTRHNYEQSLSMLSLDGVPAQSRLLRKMLPLHENGIVHKGGNEAFLTGKDDTRIEPLLEWACAERSQRLGELCVQPTQAVISGLVFVRGPKRASSTFKLDVFHPGTDIYRANISGRGFTAGKARNLTADLHDEAADIRAPAINHLGTKMLFTMRRSTDEGHAVYEMDLATKDTRQLTFPKRLPDTLGPWNDRDPTYGPNDTIWFVSTRRGQMADSGQWLDADLFELDADTGIITQRTFTPHIERKPIFFVLGEEAGGEVAFTALRDAIDNQKRAHPFRFPPGLDTEYHQHFGITPPENFFHDTREMADGRYVVTVGDLTGVWGAGRLAIIDRNFGPELNKRATSQTTSLPFYSDPLKRLDPDSGASGVVSGIYRDAVGLPDGRILVSYAAGEHDLSDPEATPDFRIELLSLTESPDGSGPVLAGRDTIIDQTDQDDWDPEPIVIRRPVSISKEPKWDRAATTGIFKHLGMPMIDGLLSNLYPSGKKTPNPDFHSVRIIESIAQGPMQRQAIPEDETVFGQVTATTPSLSSHGPSRIMAELPLASDGSFQVELPAGIPFRLQSLDAQGMAVGTMHNRWYYLAPGQTIRQGLADPDTLYAPRCAACHGSADGQPEDTFTAPDLDVITMASVTASSHEGQDPRQPITPYPVNSKDRLEVDFLDHVQPILNRRCATAGCHDSVTAAAQLDLSNSPTTHFNVAYENLLQPGESSANGLAFVDHDTGSARRSYLVELLLGEELDAPKSLPRPESAHPDSSISPKEIQTIIRWIDLGATFVGAPGK